MPRSRRRRLEAPEALEARLALSGFGPLPRNTIAVAPGAVTRPGATAEVTTAVAPRNLTPHKRSTIIGLSAIPQPGGGLRPAISGASGADGAVAVQPGAPGQGPARPAARAYARVAQAGPLTMQVRGQRGTTGAFLGATDLPGDLDGDGKVDLADSKLFQSAYLTTPLDAFYNPAADANHNGFVGMGDAKFLVRNIPPHSPNIPLRLDLSLAPGQYAPGTPYETSGAVTRLTKVTVIGRTTPGSIVFADSGLGDYTFTGPAIAADADGYFSLEVTLDPRDNLHNTEYKVIDPFGNTIIRAFPILLIPSF
jgi:hypothetical protein